jgi:Mrp family chromosome partitioning ATPase
VNTSGIEELKSVLRRSALLIVAVMLVGVFTLNAIRQLGGPHYQASARVVLNSKDLTSTLLGITPAYQDPSRLDQAEQNLVNSPELYSYAAQHTGGQAGSAGDLMAATSATVSNNVVDFTARSTNGNRSLAIVNAVASQYPSWRAQVSGKAVDAAIAQVREQIARVGQTADLEKQLQQLQVMKTLNSGDTLFVEPATSPVKTSPKPLRDSLLGGVLGLVIALLIVGGRELFDTTVRSEGDVEDALGAPVLATIDSLPRRLRASVITGGMHRFNDEYELLAANIAQMYDGYDRTVQLAVTSAVPGEGKTTTAANLAAALSRRGANVMLADFDLRKPAVSEFVGIPRSAAGVGELLSGTTDLRSVLWRVQPNGQGPHPPEPRRRVQTAAAKRAQRASAIETVEEGGHGSLTVVPGGGTSGESTRQFSKLPGLLDSLPPEADFVVIDTPPALIVAGIAELAQSVDGVIVVVRHGFVHRRRLRALGRHARSWRAHVIGAVLNDSPRDDGVLSYYYGRPD